MPVRVEVRGRVIVNASSGRQWGRTRVMAGANVHRALIEASSITGHVVVAVTAAAAGVAVTMVTTR